MKKAIVTGAAGFAGFSTTKELIERDYEVYAVVKPGSHHNKRLDCFGNSIHIIELDCCKYDLIPEMISEKCDVFFHFAWFGRRYDFDSQYKNIECCLEALKSSKKLNCSRFMGMGSQSEYGICDCVMTENIALNPIDAYGASKVSAMYLSKRLSQDINIDWVWCRMFSLYGDYEPNGRMLPDLLSNLKSNVDMELSSCIQNWDYLHARDAARAIVDLVKYGHSGEVYNIANGDYKPLKMFVEEAKSKFAYEGNIIYGSKAEPFISLQPNVDKLRNHTGWNPLISFEEGIMEYYNDNNPDE